MTELVDFLKDRIAEDEADAKAAVDVDGEHWRPVDPFSGDDYDRVEGSGDTAVGYDMYSGTCPHVARHDPARVLREIAAKRAMIGQFVDQSCMSCSSSTGGDDIGDCVARMLASVYSDHPDFKADWSI